MDIDLNEDNYDYNKLLNLFSLPERYSDNDLKHAKKKILKLHPDNCKIDVKYYYFFCKMYKKLIEIDNYTKHEKDEDNLKQNIEISNTFKRYLETNNITSLENKKKYLKEFNKMFDNIYVSENPEGHGNWLKSNENIYDKTDLDKSRKDAINENRLQKTNELEEINIYDLNSNIGHDLIESHGNPFVVMDIEKEYKNKKKFSSVFEFKAHLKKQEDSFSSLDIIESDKYLKEKELKLKNDINYIAYNKMKTREKIEKNYNEYISTFLKLNN
jgi:hypothetical protein|tara:strand:+ start:542 stop:1354 length:813 start_codon:yes stop_codon:yes gene_type:complete